MPPPFLGDLAPALSPALPVHAIRRGLSTRGVLFLQASLRPLVSASLSSSLVLFLLSPCVLNFPSSCLLGLLLNVFQKSTFNVIYSVKLFMASSPIFPWI